jgi:uncharacterized protein YycO
MSHIVIGLHHAADDRISQLMAWFTHGRYSHVALISPDGSEVIEASGMGQPKGVRAMSMEIWASRHPGFALRKIEHPFPDTVWQIATGQLGKGYDWNYLWGWLMRRLWQDPEKWVCHELIAWACQQAGHPIINMDNPQWLTPEHLYLISQPLES